jgi:two-component system response regulator
MAGELAGGRVAEILLVEDNENDVVLTRHGFRKSNLAVNLHHVEDGVECMAFLRKEGRYADVPTPDLILLDLNMPRMDGREVMAEMVQDKALRRLPVVILTTSSDEQEILSMYDLRCSSYIVKPVDFNQFQRVLSVFADYWFTVVVLPPAGDR